MEKNFQLINEKFNIDMVTEFILVDDDSFYFYIDLSNSSYLQAPFIKIAGNFPHNLDNNGCFSLSDFDKYINIKSEYIEVIGVKKYLERLQQYLNSIFDGNKNTFYMPLKLNNEEFYLDLSLKYFKDKNIVIGSLIDTTSEHKINEELLVKSYKDSLTGLFNRNTCMIHLNAIAKDSNVYIIMIDLNNFKSVNDYYGHDKGDKVLEQFGSNILKIVNDDVIYYRLAGDEFIAQVKNKTLDEVMELADQINECAVRTSFLNMKISSSIGIIKYENDMDTMDILRYVDFAMYKAKKQQGYCKIYLTRKEINEIINNYTHK